MISIIKPCCCCCCNQNLGSNEKFYIEVINECTKYVNFILGYLINGRRVMKPSPPFAPGKSERIVFPENAERLCLRVYDSSFNPPKVICTQFPSAGTITSYKVVGNAIGVLHCVKM